MQRDDELRLACFLALDALRAEFQPDNRALRAAHELGVPLVYFVPVRPGWYRPLYPAWIVDDRPSELRVLVSIGILDDFGSKPVPVLLEDTLERRYVTRETRIRLHQARFRGLVLPAYRDRCAICSLKEIRLLDAAHIVRDADPSGAAAVSNGLSLCSIHHRAFDQDLVGVSPDYRVHVSQRLREEEDGPMLELLKGFHGAPIVLPDARARRPDTARLAERFDRFKSLA